LRPGHEETCAPELGLCGLDKRDEPLRTKQLEEHPLAVAVLGSVEPVNRTTTEQQPRKRRGDGIAPRHQRLVVERTGAVGAS
jgi:hypothetical protein